MPGPNETGTAEDSPLLRHGADAPTGSSAANPPSRPVIDTSSPKSHHVPKPDTNSWPTPAGLPPAGPNDENLTIFRRALGINANLSPNDPPGGVESGRRSATGIYKAVLRERRNKSVQSIALGILVYAAHFVQIVVGAVLTALGPSSGSHSMSITILGAANTVIAGMLALIKGQGLPERLRKDVLEFRKVQDWIEETENLLAMGILGRDRREVGLLVETGFKKYNAAKASEENNKPGNYVRQSPEGPQDEAEAGEDRRAALRREDEGLTGMHGPGDLDDGRSASSGSGNALVKLNMPRHTGE